MAPQDSFIEEDEETCPLCVEELDLTDRNFRPCPCGYKLCQFCFNNIRTNLNGLCPACRRPYDDKTIEYKVVTPEELAQFKANTLKNAKKKAEQRQKEAQKREVESLNRKHLSGLRVIQKNLVYVVGLSPGIKEDDMLNTLRGDKYFGQYGKIIKIVVSKGPRGEVSQNGQPSLGIYVTFARKEDAARCIAAVNGSTNGDRVLRAQLGTTKYCSAYLRGETCTNKACMFLHEPGDNEDSYSRQDLSSINSANTQRPLASTAASSSRQQPQLQAPLQHAQPVAAATQPMAREASKDGSDSGDGSALPSSASWANRGTQQRSRRGSHATSGAASSPAISQAMPATAEADEPTETDQDHSTEGSLPVASVEVVPQIPRPQRDPVLMDLLKAINSPIVTFSSHVADQVVESLLYPPLFDDYGGEKRRAMREQQEEARLHLEQESQTDLRSVPEPVEEDEPESGSLQLGGEPEDRDNGRESNLVQGFQRRSSTQLPISRNGGSFSVGLGQNFPQNLGNLSSINGRTLTPMQQQQLILLKSSQPQSGFGDQFPPGMGSGLGQSSGLFQQQGHNRQSSRYSFANDTSSASSSVKPSANPKFLAQQSSMMPTASHVPQGSQFYGSSLPGPPPGLKSTGTPPVGFGQNHAFGGSMGGGSLFAGAGKDNDMLQNMLRGRNSAGVGQGHDAGKRELTLPSFLSQYPSASSTPAPASSLLASLYGPQTGAFHDYGQKQKKKGKKHRHANTSSSGGSGLVDLADPSILQARMQHQQQSNAGVGHGLFGGQAQDDEDLPSLDDASLEVDALVADDIPDDIAYRSFAAFDRISRSSTPSIPPGFGLPGPHAHPSAPIHNESVTPAKPASRIVPTSAPFTPSRNIPRAATPLTNVSVPPTPTQLTAEPKISETFKAKAKETMKTLASNTGLSSTIASQASTTPASLQREDFPALENTKAKAVTIPTLTKSSTAKATMTAMKKTVIVSPDSTTAIPSAAKANEKRPGILNISVPSKSAPKPAVAPEPAAKSAIAPSAFPPLPTSTPIALQSPVARTAPKTLRLVPTPKTETPTAGSATPSSTTSMFPQTFAPSRQASIASNARFERPGTPTSEIISDNASITSASMSRASSPPPSKVGSAPVRVTTKSMQKKQRREMQKEKEKLESGVIAAKPEPEPEIGPIMGRKKKQKKERTIHSAAGGSTPAVSRPATPGPAEPANEEARSVVEVAAQPAQSSGRSTPTAVIEESQKPANKPQDGKGKGKAKIQRRPTPEPVSAAPEHAEVEPAEKPIPSPAAVLQELISAGMLQDINNLNFLKPPNVNFRNQELPADVQNANPKLTISSEDRVELLAGRPVFKNVEGGSRIMLTPNGDCVRNLTREEELRYLELQARIAQEAGPAAFFSSKHHANNGFTLIGGRAVPNGPPPFFPLLNTGTTPMDPVSKIQRDEALSYINQFVLPSLSTNSQLEKALNANALDAEMLRANEASTWASWGSDPAVQNSSGGDGPYGAHHEGILATGLESMTAHFAIGKDIDRGQPLGNVSLLSLSEAETAMQMARKETENLEKRFNTMLKKNRRLLLGAGH